MPKLFSRRRLFAGFAAFGAVIGVFGIRTASARYYDGPVSDHFDGVRFFSPGQPQDKGLLELMRTHELAADDIAEVEAGLSPMTHVHCAWEYKAQGVPERLVLQLQPDTGHQVTPEADRAALAWFERWLKPAN